MTKKEQELRDKRFKKMCKWFDDAADIAEIMQEESETIKRCLLAKADKDPDAAGIASALNILNFMTAIAQSPQDYEGEAIEQRNLYPEVAFGLMQLATFAGQMRQNDDSFMTW